MKEPLAFTNILVVLDLRHYPLGHKLAHGVQVLQSAD
jgi:hypothetical protein